ncbi:MAG: NADH-quinone oxidoreductase subunit F [Candidatus Syntrophosphaera sp.]|nr:NADH-quinone oxidoreductase subunit F [Candidatus Syntrophosphaera sp.]
MVNPLYLIAVFLAAAFAVALVDKVSRKLSLGFVYAALVAVVGLAAWRLFELNQDSALASTFFTAGFRPPLSIALAFGLKEAVLVGLVNLLGLLGGISLARRFSQDGAQPMALFLLVLLGANGLILTRDIFNAFVFLEILSIAGYALIAIRQTKNSLAAGIKYMMAGGISSFILLIGIIFAYHHTGTLNIDSWIALGQIPAPAYQVAVFLIMMALFIDLKPFPANGWALDVYQSVHGSMGAVFSGIHSTALLYLMYKLLPVLPSNLVTLVAIAGLASFVLSNLLGIRQTDSKRLLGYSSVAQTGLLVFVLYGLSSLGFAEEYTLLVAFFLLLTNVLAKSGLFWLSEVVEKQGLAAWAAIRQNKTLLVSFGIFIIALSGLPPFPSFFGKWFLVSSLAQSSQPYWLAAVLLGSLFEAVYLFRWLGLVVKGKSAEEPKQSVHQYLALTGAVGFLVMGTFYVFIQILQLPLYILFPALGLFLFWMLDFLPVKLKGALAIVLLAAYSWFGIWPGIPLMGKIFALILMGGAIVQIFAFMNRKGTAEGLFPLLVMLVLSLGNILLASTKLDFFLSWEFMTVSSYLLILRGKQAEKPALNYILFSLGAAYLILSGLVLMPLNYPMCSSLLWTSNFLSIGMLPLILIMLGFLVKIGALGVHVWLPGAYAEAEDETTSLISSVLSKAGIFGMVLFLPLGMRVLAEHGYLPVILGWIGVLTALAGALMAVFEEDAKRLLAYSSMSQLGYIVAGLSLMTHLGWVSALYLTVTHMLFKGLIFMAMAGVFLRTGTRNMYELGGLIKKMPISFISVLMGIIAVSGVPPLTGFGSKWFVYTSLLESGRYLEAGVAFFASAVAFLYLYKLIHTVFLGQAKPNQSQVKEAPIWYIIPQGVFIMAIMVFSLFPNLLTKPLSLAVGDYIAKPEWLSWTGYTIHLASPNLSGYWNGNLVMYVTMGVFIVPLLWLLLVNAKTQKVKQFNIVYAAERPFKPWTTHFAYNMFAHYYKALGNLVKPRALAFWNGVGEWTYSIAATMARLYTGNGQTYLLHIFLYLITLYLLLGVKI